MSFSAEPNRQQALAALDPMGQVLDLPFEERLYPIGFPVDIASNRSEIIEAASQGWGGFAAAFHTPPLQLRVFVSGQKGTGRPMPPTYRAQEHLFAIVADAANFAFCDLNSGFTTCWLAPDVAVERAWVRHFFLDAIIYTCLGQLYVTALHGACVAKNGKGVLLCAKSGSGKSVLSLACARKGWTFVSDDVAYLVRDQPGRLVLGKPDRIRFKPSAVELHPELNGRKPICDSAGQTVVEARTDELNLTATAHSCHVDYVVFLNRHAAVRPRCVPIGREEAAARLIQDMPLYEARVFEAHQRSVRQLVEARAFELQYGTLEEGVGVLERLIATGE